MLDTDLGTQRVQQELQVLPQETNYLVNALHPEAVKIRLVAQRPFFFDERLVA
jgi:hypothetical protein